MEEDTTDTTETHEALTDPIDTPIVLEKPNSTGVIAGALAAFAVVPVAYFGGRKVLRTGREKIAARRAKKVAVVETVNPTTGSESTELEPTSD